MLRILVAALLGLIAFFPIFWLCTWNTGSNEMGAIIALALSFVGVPVLTLKWWRTTGETGMRNRVLGAVGVIWGGAMLVYGLVQGGPEGSGAYAQGQGAGLVLGGLMFAVGLYYLFRPNGKSDAQ